jgi:hypothetical protein
MGPIDYTLNVQNPLQASLAGYAGMAAVRNDQEEQAAYRQAQQQQQQLLQARQAVIQNPTAANFSSLMLLDPKSAEASQKAWEVRSQDQQRTFASDLGQWGAALINGQPQLVADALNKQADGIENTAGAPTPESQSKRDLAQLATTHPELALGKIVAILKSNGQVGGPVADSLMALQKLPSEVAKSKADATSATVDAAVKAASAPALAAKPAIDNARTQQETASSAINAKVAEFNAQINAANSQTERDKLTLERDKYVQEQAKLAQTQGQGVQDSMDSANQALDTLNQIKNHPGMTDFLTGPGTKWGAIWGKVPGSDRQALNSWVDSLKGQLGFQSLMAAKAGNPNGASGFGSLSEGEMKILSGLAGNLDPNSADFPVVLGKVEKFLQRIQSKAVANPSLPTSGGAFVMTSPKYGKVDEGRINAVLKAHPELTRADVLRYLQQQGQ